MKSNEIYKLKKLVWKGNFTVGPKISSYTLSVSCEGYGEVGVFIFQILNRNRWKLFYSFLDRDFPRCNLQNKMMSRINKLREIKERNEKFS